jgi:DNA-directed RNA polymerase specialized sigma24 family protein
MLFREYAGSMMDYLSKTRGRHCLARDLWDDVVQLVFVKFLTEPPNLEPGRRLSPLLMTMVLNAARDRAKMERRRIRNIGAAQIGRFRAAAGAEATHAQISATDAKALIEDKLKQLSAADQEALAVFVTHGPTHHAATLAAARGIPVGAAQMRVKRAKERLARAITEYDGGKEGR